MILFCLCRFEVCSYSVLVLILFLCIACVLASHAAVLVLFVFVHIPFLLSPLLLLLLLLLCIFAFSSSYVHNGFLFSCVCTLPFRCFGAASFCLLLLIFPFFVAIFFLSLSLSLFRFLPLHWPAKGHKKLHFLARRSIISGVKSCMMLLDI
jgi:hypothetical protein